jgi:DNA-binding LacI/PurR family transcriptional regulator/anti-anti-sigma regulatory factor
MSDRSKVKQGSGRRGRLASRPTIGLLTFGLAGTFNRALWSGVAKAALERDANLLCFPGNPLHPHREIEGQTNVLHDPATEENVGSQVVSAAALARHITLFDAQANVLYDLAGKESVDGLVISAAALAHHISLEEIQAFCWRYRPLPITTLGLLIEDIPGVIIDNYQGMYAAVSHLLDVHDYRRIAFVCGPEGHPEAEDRYRAYVDALAAHGLALDPNLVAPGAFNTPAGVAAVDLLFDQRRADIDAIVAASDVATLGILEALQARGIRVPEDVAVASFDDMDEARVVTPPLTTVPLLMDLQGYRAAQMLFSLLAGEPVPKKEVLPLGLRVRESCGCAAHSVERAAAGPVVGTGEGLRASPTWWAETLAAMMAHDETAGLSREQAEPLLRSLADELQGESPGAFLSTWDRLLRQIVVPGGDPALLQEVLSALRHGTLPYVSSEPGRSRAEDLWQQARVMLGEVAQRAQMFGRIEEEERSWKLRDVSTTLTTASDLADLTDLLVQGLPKLGIPSIYLSLYENPSSPTDWSSLILALDGNQRREVEPDQARFPSVQLVPRSLLPSKRRYSFVVLPLYSREQQFGLALIEASPCDGSTCDALRGQISSALRGILLLQARKAAENALAQALADVEKQVGERTAELKREVAEREQAQEENARLQQQIIETQARAIQELSTPIIPVMHRILVMPLIGAIDTLRARDSMRALLAGIREHRAKVVILDITGVPLVDTSVANHLVKTMQAARLKGTRAIITGISDAVAETLVDLGVDWGDFETQADLQTGLLTALQFMGIRLTRG